MQMTDWNLISQFETAALKAGQEIERERIIKLLEEIKTAKFTLNNQEILTIGLDGVIALIKGETK